MKTSVLGLTATMFMLLTMVTSCGDDAVEDAVAPTGLTVEVALDENTDRLVHVTATASNVNFYRFTFEEDGVLTSEDLSTGEQSYQYDSDGTYSIRVSAHSTETSYIEEVVSVVLAFNTVDTTDTNNLPFPSTGYSTPESYSGYNLVWQDEFDGDALNTSNWNYETGTGSSGWGNNELQFYREDNASVGNGVLTIEAREESFNGSNYTSSRLTTAGKQSWEYGRIDIRAAMPQGKGLWPALWMLGNNFNAIGWPRCGEIDIMEMVGGDVSDDPGNNDNTTHGTIHWDNDGTKADFGGSRTLTDPLADEFNVYSIVWDDQAIRWLVNDQQYHIADVTPADLEEFRSSFFLIVNVAVGGNWPGSPDQSTVFPQQMFVDYIRVFQEQ